MVAEMHGNNEILLAAAEWENLQFRRINSVNY